jgi:carbonic anhydrase
VEACDPPSPSAPEASQPGHDLASAGSGRWRIFTRHDVPASVVVFLVAVPLSLGIAAASGAPLVAGVVAAVVGGVVVGALSGAPLQVSGPAAGLAVIVAGVVGDYGWPATVAIVAMAGLVQVALGLCRVGRVALTLSPAVVHGMLAGIGIVIALGQVHVVLGGAAQGSAWDSLLQLPAQLVGHHDAAVLVGVITVVVLLAWPRVVKVSFLPAALAAVSVATAAAAVLDLDVVRVSLPDDPLRVPVLPRWPDAGLAAVVSGALTVAVVASVESLLSAVAVDKLHDGRRANLDRELIAQGAGNVVSGLLGGLPITGVIVRSSTNVAAGARTRASAILHGLWIALSVLLLTNVLELIPMSALAAVLVVVGLRLISVARMRTFLRHRELPVYLVTAAGVVVVDLVTAVVLGVTVALLFALYRLTRCDIRSEQQDHRRWLIHISGTLVFLGVGRLARQLRQVPPGREVVVELHLDFLDHAAFEAIEDWRSGYERLGGQVQITDVNDTWFDTAVRGRLGLRKRLPAALPHWLAPWSSWQRTHAPDAIPQIEVAAEHADAMLTGVREFERRVAPLMRPVLAHLARHGQRPQELFITCADSRIVPNLITTSGPGDLLCLRNIGNIVPAHGEGTDHSVGAAIEYAIEVLDVSKITVCGHSDCGAVRALLDGTAGANSHLAAWLRHAHPDAGRHRACLPNGDEPRLSAVERFCLAHIGRQINNLRTYPYVQDAIDTGRLQLAGMYFDLAEARMYLVDVEHGIQTMAGGGGGGGSGSAAGRFPAV